MLQTRTHPSYTHLRALWALLALVFLAACSPAPTATPSPTVIASPAANPTTPPSATPTRASAPFPTATQPVPGTATPRSATAPTRSGETVKDVTYCTPGGVPVKMDLYLPKLAAQSSPVLLFVHGGAWREGNKTAGEILRDVSAFTARGYAIVSIDYRLAPAHRWPAQIQDVKCAVRFLRANAGTYNLDPGRIAAAGSSAGGHLVALLGLAKPAAGFDVGEYLDQSSHVSAVVDLFGPTNLTANDFDISQAPLAQQVFGAKKDDDPVLSRASPVTYVSKDAPPFLILQGEKDTLVPPSQSVDLYRRLEAAGVPATLVLVKNAGHGFYPSGGPISPTLPELNKLILDFLDKYLK